MELLQMFIVFSLGMYAYWVYTHILINMPPLCFYLPGGLGQYYHVCKDINITFDDIIGCQNIKRDLKLYIKHIHSLNMGKGLFFTGPSGNGKTFMAKALANESALPFIEIDTQNTRFVSLPNIIRHIHCHYGRCIIFIDECDTIINEYSDSLLRTLDGLIDNSNIVLILATNKTIDKSLTRSGRIDKVIQFNPPSYTDRLIMFEKLNLPHVILADSTAGFSYADISRVAREYKCLMNIMNESPDMILDQILKSIKFGRQTQQFDISTENKNRIIYHEIGHCLIAYLLGYSLNGITVVPQGQILGHIQLNDKNSSYMTKIDILAYICIYLAGSVSELHHCHSTSTLSSSDNTKIDEYLNILKKNYMLSYDPKIDTHSLLNHFQLFIEDQFKKHSTEISNLYQSLQMDESLPQDKIIELIGQSKFASIQLPDNLIHWPHINPSKMCF